MNKCQFNRVGWNCPLDAEEGNDYCYWHQEIKGKKPTREQLYKLKGTRFLAIFLQEAILIGADLPKADLKNANLQEAILIGANLQNANLCKANLQGAQLQEANLQKADLSMTNLRNTDLSRANLQEVDLSRANLQGADLMETNLQKANLILANLQKTDLIYANLQKADLIKANLQNADLGEANLQGAQLQEANLQEADLSMTNLRNADLSRANLQKANLMLANFEGSNMQSTLFDTQSNLSDSHLMNVNFNESFIDYAKSLRNATIFEEERLSEKEVNEQKADEATDYDDKLNHYLASQEVYNKLYHFYSDEGMDYRAKHAHYRRAEVRRKLLRVRNKWNTKKGIYDRIRSWGFDWLILKMLTGYGESIMRPVAISIFWIIAFGLGFRHLNGVIVSGRDVTTLDYFYLSLTTFTGLGFSNVQPNILKTFVLELGILPDITIPPIEILVILESAFGVTMMALIIFVVTYQISR